jgi:hypothetical protein
MSREETYSSALPQYVNGALAEQVSATVSSMLWACFGRALRRDNLTFIMAIVCYRHGASWLLTTPVTTPKMWQRDRTRRLIGAISVCAGSR